VPVTQSSGLERRHSRIVTAGPLSPESKPSEPITGCLKWADAVEILSLPLRRATLIHQRQLREPQRIKMTSALDQTVSSRSTSRTFSTESARSGTQARLGRDRVHGSCCCSGKPVSRAPSITYSKSSSRMRWRCRSQLTVLIGFNPSRRRIAARDSCNSIVVKAQATACTPHVMPPSRLIA